MSDALVIDLTNYKDRVGARVEEGRYTVIVDDVDVEKSQQGNDMIMLWLRVVGGESDSLVLIDRLTITEKSMFRVVGFMNALGLPTPKKKLQISPKRFIGQTLAVDVADGEPYNGRIKSEVKGYIRTSKTRSNAAESEDLESDGIGEFAPATTSNPAPAAGAAVTTAATTESAPASTAQATSNIEADAADDSEIDLDAVEL